MSVFCGVGLHKAAERPVWNNGFYFGACARCGCDLVRGAQGRWRAVPRGFRVVWRQRPPGYPDWSATEPEQTPTGFLPRATSLSEERASLSSMIGRS